MFRASIHAKVLEVFPSHEPTGGGPNDTRPGPFPAGNQRLLSLVARHFERRMVVPVSFQPTLKTGTPRELFKGPFINVPGFSCDVAPDGQRFLMLVPEHPDTPVTDLHVAVNWIEDLKRRVPVESAAGKQ